MTAQALSQIEKYLWPRGETRDVWMIVDTARDRRIFPMLLECHLEYSCLYSGPLSPELEVAAPYLVQLDHDYRDTRRLLTHALGNNWGVFLRCDTRLERLRRHLRGLLMVRDPRGNRLVFRYYDPRVLRVYLPTCTPAELRTMFGPITRFWMEDESPDILLEYGLSRMQLVGTKLSLNVAAITQEKPAPADDDPGARDRAYGDRALPLTIRQEQLNTFSDREVLKFEGWMLAHLRKFFPDQCAAAGDGELRRIVQYGRQRAAAYGIAAKRDVCKYIDLIMIWGRDFEADPRFPWAMEILERQVDSASKVAALADYTESASGGAENS